MLAIPPSAHFGGGPQGKGRGELQPILNYRIKHVDTISLIHPFWKTGDRSLTTLQDPLLSAKHISKFWNFKAEFVYLLHIY
jgi:hypothetical protein